MRPSVLVLALFVLALCPGPARADSDPPNESARQHFAAGVKLYDAKDYEGALAQFRLAYADKAAAAIKRNIALCLKGLDRYPEAMDALDEMLAEGGESIKPAVREAAERTRTELAALTGSLRITVRVHTRDPSLAPPIELVLDGAPLPVSKLADAVRVMPGEHVLHAHGAGFQEATQTVAAEAGVHDVPVTLDLNATAPEQGRLVVRAAPGAPSITIDGVALGRAEWAGPVGVGTHRVVVSAPSYVPYEHDVYVPAGRTVEVRVRLWVASSAPVLPAAPPIAPVRPRTWYGIVGVGLQAESLVENPTLSRDSSPTARGFGGYALSAKIGRQLTKVAALELLGEGGSLATSYGGTTPAELTVLNWVVAPELTLHSAGRMRLVGGFALGVEGQSTRASVANPTGGSVALAGAGAGPMALLEAGVESVSNHFFFQALLFGDGHGVSAVDASGTSLYVNPPAFRGGLRVTVGYQR